MTATISLACWFNDFISFDSIRRTILNPHAIGLHKWVEHLPKFIRVHLAQVSFAADSITAPSGMDKGRVLAPGHQAGVSSALSAFRHILLSRFHPTRFVLTKPMWAAMSWSIPRLSQAGV